MPTIVSSNKIFSGVYRAVVIEFIKDAVEDKTLKSARIYIPALHREQMPFDINEDGTISGCIFNESENNEANDLDKINDSESNLIASKNITTKSQLIMSKYDYPIAQICSWNVCPELKLGDAVWVMFENGDSEFPVIVGSLGSSLAEISQISVGTNSTMLSPLSLTNKEFVQLAISLIAEFESGNRFIGLKSNASSLSTQLIINSVDNPFTLGYIGFSKHDAIAVIKLALSTMTKNEKKQYDPNNELSVWVNNLKLLVTDAEWWNYNLTFRSVINDVVTSEKGIEAQKIKAKEIVKGYINTITQSGIMDPKITLYLADIMHQYGKSFIKTTEYENIKAMNLDETNDYWKSRHSEYNIRRDMDVAKIKEFEDEGKLKAYMTTNGGGLNTNYGGTMTMQQFFDMFTPNSSGITNVDAVEWGTGSGTQCPELPKYFIEQIFGIPTKIYGMGNGNSIYKDFANCPGASEVLVSVPANSPGFTLMPGDIVSLEGGSYDAIYGHTGIVKSVNTNNNFVMLEQWEGCGKIRQSTLNLSSRGIRLIGVARAKSMTIHN